jgi:hypothetical protein
VLAPPARRELKVFGRQGWARGLTPPTQKFTRGKSYAEA